MILPYIPVIPVQASVCSPITNSVWSYQHLPNFLILGYIVHYGKHDHRISMYLLHVLYIEISMYTV